MDILVDSFPVHIMAVTGLTDVARGFEAGAREVRADPLARAACAPPIGALAGVQSCPEEEVVRRHSRPLGSTRPDGARAMRSHPAFATRVGLPYSALDFSRAQEREYSCQVTVFMCTVRTITSWSTQRRVHITLRRQKANPPMPA
ncbi:hypothetical protein QTI66_29640 [Variovorax sp. J22R133]|uniref:hypothetical protein n=1 Tax=Variovorax brevis TaxID=3053503 RepID=UPI002578B864|nr:hypothetical protein [Variovorax sp. J22R133]MDM0116325.1 hypothetical protein [Variovorax sp. J22R133]